MDRRLDTLSEQHSNRIHVWRVWSAFLAKRDASVILTDDIWRKHGGSGCKNPPDRAQEYVPQLVLIAGTGRSGSTLLANLLASNPATINVGEGRYFWERGALQNRTCACGQSFSDCEFWQAIAGRLSLSGARVRRLAAGVRGMTRIRNMAKLSKATGPVSDIRDAYSDLYTAVFAASGASCVIDSSKLPTFVRLISGLEGINTKVLHLTRDPRAAAYSWQRKKPVPDRIEGNMQTMGPLKSSALWALWNSYLARRFRDSPDYLRVRYEDLVMDPAGKLADISTWLGWNWNGTTAQVTGVSVPTYRRAASFGFAGNPNRFDRGEIFLVPDTQWKEGLRPGARRTVNLITASVAKGLGYRRWV